MHKHKMLLVVLTALCSLPPALLYSQVDTAWVRRYNGPSGTGGDYASAMAVDGTGNVYVTGRSSNGANYDYATIKYNAAGDTLWVRRYNGSGNGADYAYAIKADGAGNVYVTGQSSGGAAPGTGNDYATIKYNAAGDTLWVRRYNGPLGTGADVASALAVDSAGNVYVTGNSNSGAAPGTGYDYATIKYNAAGETLWVRRYVGSPGGGDYASAIAVDGAGNVYVTGYSTDPGATVFSFATIKYNSNGDTLWVRRYKGPGTTSDTPRAIAVDGAGNVYVTGQSSGPGTPGQEYDYATIKYNAAGDTLWVRRYNGPGNSTDWAWALAVDGAGNVYVTGQSAGIGTALFDYATIKYNSAGDTLWVSRYNGPGDEWDIAYAIAVDGTGNVYVTGYSRVSGTNYDYATIKYNSAGVEQWVSSYNGPGNGDDQANAIALDGAGNIYVTGYSPGSGTGNDYTTIKYSPIIDTGFVKRYNGPADSSDMARAIAVDGAGNVYVTGESRGVGTYSDYATIKYNAYGVQQWVKRYNPGVNQSGATAITVDAQGYIYVTGFSEPANGLDDFATIKYNSNGDTVWVRRYNGPVNNNDNGRCVKVDNLGNVYVAGESYGSSMNYDYVTIKYNSNGDTLWTRRYNGTGNSNDNVYGLVIDSMGNVYVTGISIGSGTGEDWATVKYNSSGVEQWVKRYSSSGNYNDGAYAMSLDISGNIYITGWKVINNEDDICTIKYNSNGDTLWVRIYNGPRNNDDDAFAIAVDVSGNVYVTGWCDWYVSNPIYHDYMTIKYNSAGAQQWVQRYNGTGNSADVADKIVLDNSGNVYVTGYSTGTSSGYDYATVKYNSSGVQQGVQRYNGTGNAQDIAMSMAIDGLGNVYVTGYSYGSSTNYDYVTIKYIPTGALEENREPLSVHRLSLIVYPNPARAYFNIRLPSTANRSEIKIFDVTGKIVKSEELKGKNNRISLDGIKNGVYFVKVGNEMVKEKLVVTK